MSCAVCLLSQWFQGYRNQELEGRLCVHSFHVEHEKVQTQALADRDGVEADFVVFQSISRVLLFATPWTAARQAPLSFTVSWSLLRFMLIESMMPSNHLIFCLPLLLLPAIFPSIRVFSSESALHIRWPEYWSFSCNSDLVGFKSSFPKYHLTQLFIFYFYFFYIELMSNVVIVSGTQQRGSAIHMSILPQTPLLSKLPHNTDIAL